MKGLKKIQKIILIVIAILVVITAIYAVLVFIPNKNKERVIQSEETIKFDYVKNKRDTRIYKTTFNELKNVLNSDNIDYDKYAEYISKLFIMDFYTLNNKNSKNDVGGVQYIMPSMKENFILNASDTIYKYIKINDNKKELPVVKNVELDSIKKSTYTHDKTEYTSYEVSLNFTYEKDLGYETSAILVLVRDNEKLYIVEKGEVNG